MERMFPRLTFAAYNPPSFRITISRSWDELRKKFVSENWELTLMAQCDLERGDPFHGRFRWMEKTGLGLP